MKVRRKKLRGTSAVLVSRLAVASSFVALLLLWIFGSAHLPSKQATAGGSRLRVAGDSHGGLETPQDRAEVADVGGQSVIALFLDEKPKDAIRIAVLDEECPLAAEFISWIVDNQKTDCHACTIYRGEPVPSYWGSKDYPDRWDNGGRWGPPYALIQGGFLNTRQDHIQRENHRPQVKRGMVAWAGLEGVHFFVALADHPEWGHEHTVWGRVFEEDMPTLDMLVKTRELNVLKRSNPVVTNFANPMHFTVVRM